MKLSDAPSKLILAFAAGGGKNTIPVASQIGITDGAASFTDGFPPLTRTNEGAGGVPPDGLDMNGILYDATAINLWLNSGAGFVYDATFAGDIGGYPAGSVLLRTDKTGYWLNTVDDNSTDPEAFGTGWVPYFTNGISAITMTGSNVTLTALEAGKPIIRITGTLTGNLNLIFPTTLSQWLVINATTGAFSITCKTSAGTGVAVTQSAATPVYGDGSNINFTTTLPVASETVAGIQENATQAETNAGVSDTVTVTPAKMRFGFEIVLAATGYIKFPQWMGSPMIQWASVTHSVGTATISWYTPFPNAVFNAQFTVLANDYTTDGWPAINAVTLNDITVYVPTATLQTKYVMAVGY